MKSKYFCTSYIKPGSHFKNCLFFVLELTEDYWQFVLFFTYESCHNGLEVLRSADTEITKYLDRRVSASSVDSYQTVPLGGTV